MLMVFREVRRIGAPAIVIYARGMAGDCDSYQRGREQAPGGEWQGLAVNANGREQLTEERIIISLHYI